MAPCSPEVPLSALAPWGDLGVPVAPCPPTRSMVTWPETPQLPLCKPSLPYTIGVSPGPAWSICAIEILLRYLLTTRMAQSTPSAMLDKRTSHKHANTTLGATGAIVRRHQYHATDNMPTASMLPPMPMGAISQPISALKLFSAYLKCINASAAAALAVLPVVYRGTPRTMCCPHSCITRALFSNARSLATTGW